MRFTAPLSALGLALVSLAQHASAIPTATTAPTAESDSDTSSWITATKLESAKSMTTARSSSAMAPGVSTRTTTITPGPTTLTVTADPSTQSFSSASFTPQSNGTTLTTVISSVISTMTVTATPSTSNSDPVAAMLIGAGVDPNLLNGNATVPPELMPGYVPPGPKIHACSKFDFVYNAYKVAGKGWDPEFIKDELAKCGGLSSYQLRTGCEIKAPGDWDWEVNLHVLVQWEDRCPNAAIKRAAKQGGGPPDAEFSEYCLDFGDTHEGHAENHCGKGD
ncbi:hypothetical protein AC579_6151 [Pseudocercospora musae]|uniref:Uncharacterized protein n=1 Tax=Pseudocercospora musae TaxID=113226 RepID=A0A139I531_9PEZI|nr:hypothetical protein AC579_6151 [Pseudocercospora musae]